MWTEKDFWNNSRWYHGTTLISAQRIINDKVRSDINKGDALDFGYGFYLCPNIEWALKFAKQIVNPSNAAKYAGIYVAKPVVMEFEFAPMDMLPTMKYKFFPSPDYEFAKFVFSCRKHIIYHPFKKSTHNFDIIGGPMADGAFGEDFEKYDSRDISKRELLELLTKHTEDWQLLLHSQKACDRLKYIRTIDEKGDEVDVRKI